LTPEISLSFGSVCNESVVAGRRDINFARRFFEVNLFIIAVQQNFRNALTKRLRSEIALDSPGDGK
jgi:hypothetical protein